MLKPISISIVSYIATPKNLKLLLGESRSILEGEYYQMKNNFMIIPLLDTTNSYEYFMKSFEQSHTCNLFKHSEV